MYGRFVQQSRELDVGLASISVETRGDRATDIVAIDRLAPHYNRYAGRSKSLELPNETV